MKIAEPAAREQFLGGLKYLVLQETGFSDAGSLRFRQAILALRERRSMIPLVHWRAAMRPGKQEWTGSQNLFRARLDQIINMRHELVRLAGTIDWDWIDAELAGCFSGEGRPGLSTRFMIGLLLLKHIYGLSDEEVCARWEFDPYFRAPRAHVSGMLRRKEEKNESLAPCCEGA